MAKGKVQAEEMRQLAEAGIPAWKILAATLNTDVAGAMKLVEQRGRCQRRGPGAAGGMNKKVRRPDGAADANHRRDVVEPQDQIGFTLADIGRR